MDYNSMVLYFLLPLYLYDSLAAYSAYLLAGRRMPYRKVFAWQLPLVIIQSMAYSAWMFIDSSSNILIEYLLTALFFTSEIVLIVPWIYFLFRDTDKKKRFFYVSTVYPFTYLASSATNILTEVILELIEISYDPLVWTPEEIFLQYASLLLVYGGVAAAIRLVSKTNFWSKLQDFQYYPKMFIPMGITYFLFYTIFGTFGSEFMPYPWLIISINLFYLALLSFTVFLVSDLKRTANLNAVQNLLLQQQRYINKLESIQQELRGIQHDYKNMLSGLYAQASEGNAEAVKEFIGTKLLKVDETVREDLIQMNQLTRIEISELKGLILTKILEAERDRVPFRLEVMFPVFGTFMAIEDLLRCVGILLDNAIEEVREQKGAAVTLLLLQEDKTLTIVVKNPVQDKPELALIRNEGYSTKGPGRGVGLFNYQNIIRKYPNATQETKIEGKYFLQVLALAGK